MTKILIFGDICPTRDTQAAFDRGDREAIFGDVLPVIESADIVIGNLECAVTDRPSPIRKAGPVLYTGTQSMATLKDFDALSLANNHIRDCGDEGVTTAIATCTNLGIRTVGAGANIEVARQPIVIDAGGLKIGLMTFAEQEFNIATPLRPGACYLDIYDDFDRIRQFRETVDYLIVLYHGGIEYFPYPSPELKRKCRKFAECGADLVSCQHSHCIGTVELYHGSTVVYGQGNSVFGYRAGNESWNRGLLVEIDIDNALDAKQRATISLKPMVATPDGLKWMDNSDAATLKAEMEKRANDSDEHIAAEWDKFCRDLCAIHLPLLLGWPRLLVALNRRTKNSLIRLLYGRKASNITHNLLRCEAHCEVIDYVLSRSDYE